MRSTKICQNSQNKITDFFISFHVTYCYTGDLIQSLLHFCDLVGWKQELLELMNEKVGTFLII